MALYHNDMAKDNCTLFPEGTWSHCCARHDRRYENTRISKLQADKLLFRCVKKESLLIAIAMFSGVTLFGYYWYCKAQHDS